MRSLLTDRHQRPYAESTCGTFLKRHCLSVDARPPVSVVAVRSNRLNLAYMYLTYRVQWTLSGMNEEVAPIFKMYMASSTRR